MSKVVEMKYVSAEPNPAGHDFVSVTVQPRPTNPNEMMTDFGGAYTTDDRSVAFINEKSFAFSNLADAIEAAEGIAQYHGISVVYVIDRWSEK